jgi:tetratricopeptide (TPR) repeat protein
VLLELGQPREAAAEFDRALARWPNRSLSLLGRARAAAALGDREAARRHAQRLLANWQGADPDLADLKEARSF